MTASEVEMWVLARIDRIEWNTDIVIPGESEDTRGRIPGIGLHHGLDVEVIWDRGLRVRRAFVSSFNGGIELSQDAAIRLDLAAGFDSPVSSIEAAIRGCE